MPKETKICSVDGCEVKAKARGWCPRHWKRWRAHGDPTYAKFEPIRGGTDEERFWAKVTPTGFCWYWGGSCTGSTTDGKGHDYFNLGADSGRKGVVAHKFSYETLVGPVPDGLELDHLCRNPPCVNPDHLEPVTHAENMRRGFAPAQHSVRTKKCGYGHDISTEEKVYTNGRVQVRSTCKICAARRQRAYLDRKKARAA